jgi:phosphoribosylaminoimidazolecarboxamide formyltransferase / IMP cyclohydrolase
MNNSKYALISVSDKSNLKELCLFLFNKKYTIISTGGTYNKIKELCGTDNLKKISDITKFPEILGGRVKTLHPIISGSLLYSRNNKSHLEDVTSHKIPNIDLVVVNLYPFEETVTKSNGDLDKCIENIDIGGHTLIRECIKNYKYMTILSNPDQYRSFISNYDNNDEIFRQGLALDASRLITNYDISITKYYSDLCNNKEYVYRKYNRVFDFKYGCNPHQKDSSFYALDNNPIEVLNGKVGYINMIDALHSWQLVYELSESLDMNAAASFKHTSPAGVGTSHPLSKDLAAIYDVSNLDLTPLATAFIRARYADPMSSFGDFIALSHEVDVCTANLIKREISDGIIAPSYSKEALEILKSKRGGKYLILQIDPKYFNNQDLEFKEINGLALSQNPNNYKTNINSLLEIKTKNKTLNINAVRDMIIANISLKYAQSNNVSYAYDGQLIGLAAGQQNRVDCVKLAGNKSRKWFLMQHPKVILLRTLFKDGVKRQDKINAVISYINNDFNETEYKNWTQLFTQIPEKISDKDKKEYLMTISNVSMASDAFFPFRDNIDEASKYGVKYIIQPGGSMADESIIGACNDYKMLMSFSNTRMFYH